MTYYYSKSKKFAIVIFIVSSILAGFCAWKGLEGATSAIFSTGTIASTALYANRQLQETNRLKIEKGNKNGQSE